MAPPPPSIRRADFERAWLVFSSKRTEADYRAWRDQRDWTAENIGASTVATDARDWRASHG